VASYTVSILILLDVLLQLSISLYWQCSASLVSILILLDVLLQLKMIEEASAKDASFNPYFTGCSTSTIKGDWEGVWNGMFQSLFYWMFYFNGS